MRKRTNSKRIKKIKVKKQNRANQTKNLDKNKLRKGLFQ